MKLKMKPVMVKKIGTPGSGINFVGRNNNL